MDDSALQRVEQKCSELADNISRLRKSLHYWQTLEIDYEGLKEEIQLLPEDSSLEERLQAARDFRAESVDEKELQAILCTGPSRPRPPSTVIDLLSKRVDYVTRNIVSIRKQITDVEKKRNALLLAEEPEHRDEAGLPLAEITEELDEDGNVVSSKIETPGAETTQLIDVLRKAGVNDLKEINGTVTGTSATDKVEPGADSEDDEPESTEEPQAHVDAAQPFSVLIEGTEPGLDSQSVAKSSRTDTSKTNSDDTPEEAALRNEMLNYGLDEVGAIVAELDLEENASDISYDEDDVPFDIDQGLDQLEEDSESEDETGKSKSLNIPATYKQQMKELQERLGLNKAENLGPDPDLADITYTQASRPTAAEAARKAAIARHDAAQRQADARTSSATEKPVGGKSKKKKVAFAQTLDVADELPEPFAISKDDPSLSVPGIAAIEENVVERPIEDDKVEALPPAPAPPVLLSQKVSKFRSARSSTPQTPLFPPPMDFPSSAPKTPRPIPEGPKDKIIADALVEHDSFQDDAPPTAPDEDDFNEQIQKQELAKEYYRLRNMQIRQQGGFVHGGEDDNYGDDIAFHPVEDEETGRIRKISRFKAARIKS